MKHRNSKRSRAAIKAAAKAMKPTGTVSDLNNWNGRNATAVEWELIERREINKPKLPQNDYRNSAPY
jgi:hypothetical protein